jgi:hypothetical protein
LLGAAAVVGYPVTPMLSVEPVQPRSISLLDAVVAVKFAELVFTEIRAP